MEPKVISRTKSSTHTREPGRIYQAIVTSTREDGRVFVKIPTLSVNVGPILPLNTSPSKRLSVDDTVACAFTDSYNSSLVIFGSATQVADDFSISRYATSIDRDAQIPSPQEGRTVYILDSDELQIYNGSTWITVIDTGSSENLSIETLSVSQTSTFGGDLTVDTNVLKVNTSTNRVGIGTSSPSTQLHVSSGSSGDSELRVEADTDNNDENDNAAISLVQDGGIVEGVVGLTSNLLNIVNSVSTGGGIAFKVGTTNIYTNAQDVISGTTEHMRITSAGNVGIGTQSPAVKLDIVGSANVSGDVSISGYMYGVARDTEIKFLMEAF